MNTKLFHWLMEIPGDGSYIATTTIDNITELLRAVKCSNASLIKDKNYERNRQITNKA